MEYPIFLILSHPELKQRVIQYIKLDINLILKVRKHIVAAEYTQPIPRRLFYENKESSESIQNAFE